MTFATVIATAGDEGHETACQTALFRLPSCDPNKVRRLAEQEAKVRFPAEAGWTRVDITLFNPLRSF